MFFELVFIDVLEITSNGTADVLHISHEQREWGFIDGFEHIVNAAGATDTF